MNYNFHLLITTSPSARYLGEQGRTHLITMRIKVKSLQGDEYMVEVQNEQSVSQLKSSISEKANGLAIERIKLVYKGRTMQDACPVSDYNLEDNCKVHLILQKEISSSPVSAIKSPETTTTCPMDTSSSHTGVTSNTSSGNSPVNKSQSGPSSAFETILRKRLVEIFPPDQVDKIIANIHNEISDDINSSSLDDLERLAEQKLHISNE